MKRPVRSPIDGTYTIDGKKYKELFGSREQVMNGTAYKTPGELTTDDLLMNKNGRIVSAVKFKTAKKERRLEKYGYFAKKGKFGYVRGKPKVSLNSTSSNKVGNGKAVTTPNPPSLSRRPSSSSKRPSSLSRRTRKRKMKGGNEESAEEKEKEDDEAKNE